MGFEEIMCLRYPIFLSFLKHHRVMDLQESEEGRAYLAQIERLKVVEPDFDKLRAHALYQGKEGNSQ